MLSKKAILLLLVAELIIPVLGYFLWSWDYSFILFFYLFDWIFFLIFQGVKMRKRLQFTSIVNEKKEALKVGTIYLLTFSFSIIIILFSIIYTDPKFDVIHHFNNFFMYKDMGIEQGYILIPLTLMNAQRGYKTQFLNPKLAERYTIRQIFSSSKQQHIILFISVALICSMLCIFSLSLNVLLFGCIAGVFLGKVYFQLIKN